jgi:hypothetical protein
VLRLVRQAVLVLQEVQLREVALYQLVVVRWG